MAKSRMIEKVGAVCVIHSSDDRGTRISVGEERGEAVEARMVLARTKAELRAVINALRGFIDDMPDGEEVSRG